jgi:hypothetical protein
MMSTNLCVRSSSLRCPLSNVIEGLAVTGGTGNTVRIIHSGLALFGFIPKRAISSSGIFSSRSLTSLGINLRFLSFSSISMYVEGLSNFMTR